MTVTVDRLTENSGLQKYSNKKVYFDYKYLKTQEDENYLKGKLEMFMSKYNCLIVDKKENSDVIIQVLCGVLGTDYNTIFIGVPSFPVPMPDTSISIVVPEIPIFKLYDRKAYGYLSLNVLDTKTYKSLYIGETKASSTHKNWVVLLIPFSTMNFTMDDTQDTDTHVDFIPELK